MADAVATATETPLQTAALAPTESTPEPSDAPEPPETEGAENQPTTLWFHELESDDALKEHETVKGWLTETETKARNEGRDAAIEELRPALSIHNKSTEKLQNSIESFKGQLSDAVESLSESDLRRVMAGADKLADALNGVYFHSGSTVGQMNLLKEMAKAFGDDKLTSSFMTRLDYVLAGADDPSIGADFVKKLSDSIRERHRDADFKAGYTKGKEDATTVAKARERANGGGPNLAPEGGVKTSLAAKIQDGSASLAEIAEARKQGLLEYK